MVRRYQALAFDFQNKSREHYSLTSSEKKQGPWSVIIYGDGWGIEESYLTVLLEIITAHVLVLDYCTRLSAL